MRKNSFYIYPAAALVGYSNRQWLSTLKRSTGRMPPGWKWWTWQFVRPENAWLSRRGFICWKESWLPAHYEKVPIVSRPLPDMIEYEEAPCVIEGGGC